MSAKLPNDTAHVCRGGECVTFHIHDSRCQKLTDSVMGKFTFTDSAGVAHKLDFKGGSATLGDVHCGMGELRFTGTPEELARACGFKPGQDGKEHVSEKEKTCLAQRQQRDAAAPLKDRFYHDVTYKDLTERPLQAEVKRLSLCTEHYIQVATNRIDWVVIMAFMDNHSGNLHGSGHAGAFIINGETREGLYTDFGPYTEIRTIPTTPNEPEKKIRSFSEIRISPAAWANCLTSDSNLNPDGLGKAWNKCNKRYGSDIYSSHTCLRLGFYGPEHEHELIYLPEGAVHKQAPPHFAVNGIIGWAAFRLRAGAYKEMKAFAQRCSAFIKAELSKFENVRVARDSPDPASSPETQNPKEEALKKPNLPRDPYSGIRYNCMTYAVAVYEQGIRPDVALPGDFTENINAGIIDHPNAHISDYMRRADAAGYFDHRKYKGEPEAETGVDQSKTPGILHYTQAAPPPLKN